MSRRKKPTIEGISMAEENSKPGREKVKITDLHQLAVQDIDVTIQMGDYDLEIPMRTLTFGQWVQVDRDIPMPEPPAMGGPKGKIYDRQDPGYLRNIDEVAQKRMLLRIARSLRIDGIDRTTPQSEIDCLQEAMDNSIINGLAQIITQLHQERNARIEARANSFQPR